MFHFEKWPEPHARYPEQLAVAAPKGTKSALKQAARVAGMSVPDFIRQTVAARILPPTFPSAAPAASTAMVFAQERFVAVRNEIAPLWQMHYDEIAQDKDLIPLDPDWRKYAELEAGGFLVIITARKAGALVGYIFAAVDTHLHYRSTVFAQLDLYFLMPAHRGGRSALRMFEALEKALKARGVVKVNGNTKLAADHGRLFEAMGWRESERLYVKMLGAA